MLMLKQSSPLPEDQDHLVDHSVSSQPSSFRYERRDHRSGSQFVGTIEDDAFHDSGRIAFADDDDELEGQYHLVDHTVSTRPISLQYEGYGRDNGIGSNRAIEDGSPYDSGRTVLSSREEDRDIQANSIDRRLSTHPVSLQYEGHDRDRGSGSNRVVEDNVSYDRRPTSSINGEDEALESQGNQGNSVDHEVSTQSVPSSDGRRGDSSNQFIGTSGDDEFHDNGRILFVDGREGFDIANYSTATRTQIFYLDGSGPNYIIRLKNIEKLIATDHPDIILGSEQADIIVGSKGNDIIIGGVYDRSPNNQLFFKPDDVHYNDGIQDLLIGGEGSDTYYLYPSVFPPMTEDNWLKPRSQVISFADQYFDVILYSQEVNGFQFFLNNFEVSKLNNIDKIIDDDGSGSIFLSIIDKFDQYSDEEISSNGVRISQNSISYSGFLGLNIYYGNNGKVVYLYHNDDLYLFSRHDFSAEGMSIGLHAYGVIENFKNGDFEIRFDIAPKSGPDSDNSYPGNALVSRQERLIYDAKAGDDEIDGSQLDDSLCGGEGNDVLNGRAGNDDLNGGEGNDRLNGDVGNDTLNGGAGNDQLRGGEGNDFYCYVFADGYDVIEDIGLSSDSDVLYLNGLGVGDVSLHKTGAGGKDLLIMIHPTTENIMIKNQFKNEGNDGFSYGLESIKLSGTLENNWEDSDLWDVSFTREVIPDNTTHGDDVYGGGEGENVILGLGGDDTLSGEEGNDTLYGQQGNDRLLGGEGNDDLNGGEGDDYIVGENGDDYIIGEDGKDDLWGGDGDDKIHGGEGDDSAYGGNGNDYISGEGGDDTLWGQGGRDKIHGGVGDDYIDGGDGNDYIFGQAGNDQLFGNNGNDQIYSYIGDDTIEGGEGNDRLEGGEGNDTLKGGEGDDVFSFKDNFGHDVIEDFAASKIHGDTLSFVGLPLTTVFDVLVRTEDRGEDTIIRFDEDNSITLLGVQKADFQIDDFQII